MVKQFSMSVLCLSLSSCMTLFYSLDELKSSDNYYLHTIERKAKFLFDCDEVTLSVLERSHDWVSAGYHGYLKSVAAKGCKQRTIFKVLAPSQNFSTDSDGNLQVSSASYLNGEYLIEQESGIFSSK